MSHPLGSAEMLEEVHKQLSASTQPSTMTTRGVMIGRVVLVDHPVSAVCDPFESRYFQLIETSEVLDLTTVIRVHEELQIHRTHSLRLQVVSTTLRRELAEVVEADATL